MRVKIAAPRIVLAIFISIIVVKPLEVRLFAARLTQTIEDLQLRSQEDFKTRRNRVFGKDEVNRREEEVRLQVDSMATIGAGEPVKDFEYEALKASTLASQQNKEQKEKDNRPRIAQLEVEIELLEKNPPVYQLDSIGVKRPAGTSVVDLSNKNQLLREMKSELKNAQKAFTNAQNSQQNYLKTWRQEMNSVTEGLRSEGAKIQKMKDSLDRAMRPDIIEGDSAIHIAYTDNFVTQIEALGELTGVPFSTMWWMHWLIVILFMLIETSPILVKMISPSSPYDDLLEAESVRLKAKSAYDANTQIMMDEQDNLIKFQTYMQIQQTRSSEVENVIKAWALRRRAALKQSQGSWSDDDYKKYIEEMNAFSDELLKSINNSGNGASNNKQSSKKQSS